MSYPPDTLEWDQLKADIKRRTTIVDVYRELRPDAPRKDLDGEDVRCIARGHDDEDPSMGLNNEKGFKCLGCGASGSDVFDLWALAYGRSTDGEDFKQTAGELADHCGLNLEEYARNGDTADVEQPPPPRPKPPADNAPTRPQSDAVLEAPPVRREVFRRIWDVVRPLDLTDQGRAWLESREIPPFVAQGYGCRDWQPVMGEILDLVDEYDDDERDRAGLTNNDGELWWPLRSYAEDRPTRGLAIPIWHPEHREAPVGVRWRTYHPDPDGGFPPKVFGQPGSDAVDFEAPPMGLCEPSPVDQVMLEPLHQWWLSSHVDTETQRGWLDDDQFRPLGDYPGGLAVVLCEGETDWLAAAAAANDVETDTRIVPVGLTSKSSSLTDTTLDAVAGANHVHVALDGKEGYDPESGDDPPNWYERCSDVVRGMVARNGTAAERRFTYSTYPENNDLNDLRAAGQLTDKLDSWIRGDL